MTAQHTPGPWREFRDADGHDIIAPDGTHIARVEPVNSCDPLAEQDANADLLAAAPELLAACRDMLLDLEAMAVGADTAKWPSLFARIAAAKAAIAKARGSIPQCAHGIDEDDACDRCDAAMHGQEG